MDQREYEDMIVARAADLYRQWEARPWHVKLKGRTAAHGAASALPADHSPQHRTAVTYGRPLALTDESTRTGVMTGACPHG